MEMEPSCELNGSVRLEIPKASPSSYNCLPGRLGEARLQGCSGPLSEGLGVGGRQGPRSTLFAEPAHVLCWVSPRQLGSCLPVHFSPLPWGQPTWWC